MHGKTMAMLLALAVLATATGTVAAGSKPGGAGNEVVGEFQNASVSQPRSLFDRHVLVRIDGK